MQAKNLDLEMWHAAENVWVARVGDKSLKKSPNSLLFQFSKDKSLINQIIPSIRRGKKKTFSLRGGGGPQIGEVTCGRSPHLSCKCDQLKMRDYIDSRLPHLSSLPHLPGAPHLHVNRPLIQI